PIRSHGFHQRGIEKLNIEENKDREQDRADRACNKAEHERLEVVELFVNVAFAEMFKREVQHGQDNEEIQQPKFSDVGKPCYFHNQKEYDESGCHYQAVPEFRTHGFHNRFPFSWRLGSPSV